ncbi:hypothetical protein NU195Hw_g1352t1 [Hortaea werneckii]
MVPWNENQRTTTYLLFKDDEFADLPLPDKVRIFNHLHSGERGENVTVKKLSEAFSRRSDERAAKGWAVVCDTDNPDDEEMERRTAFRQGVLQNMRDAVVSLGIEDGDIVVVASIEKGESSRAAENPPSRSQDQPFKESTMASGSTTGVKRKTPPTTIKRGISPVASPSRPAAIHQAPQPGSERRVPPPAATIDRRANTIPSVINVRRDYTGHRPVGMMHYNDMIWDGSAATAKTSRLVDDSSQIYFLGGPIHEILLPSALRPEAGLEDTGKDNIGCVMICRRELCVECSSTDEAERDGLDRARHAKTNTDLLLGLPFVHSSECDIQTAEDAQRNPSASADEYGRKPRLMRFHGARKGYSEAIPERLFSCLVQYNSDNGVMRIAKMMMCQKMYCRQCSSKKTVEDARERDRTLVEGRGWWRNGMDDGKQRESKRRKVDTN